MDWRRLVFLVCALLWLSPRLPGQGPAVSPQPAVTVLGDVARPGKFAVQTEATVRAAVAGATPLGDSMNVTILRQGQQRAQWSRAIRMSAADNSERVADGDVLLVESLSPLTQQPARNAVVRGGGVTTVVSLEDNGVTVNDVLVGLGIPAGPGTRLSLSARLRSQPPMNPASLSTVVQHGDVILVSQADPSMEQSQGERSNTAAVRPAYSEWGGAVAQAPPVPPVPNMFAASTGQSTTGNSAVSAPPNFGAVPPVPMSEPVVDSVAGSGFGGAVADVPGSAGGFSSGQPPAVSERDVRELMTLEEQLQSSPIAGELSTHREPVRTTASAPLAAAAVRPRVTAPAADIVESGAGEIGQPAGAAGNQLLNGFVVAALLLSGCWVLAKSVTVSGRVVTERVSDVSAAPVMGPVPQMSPAVVSQPVVSQPVVKQPVVKQPVVKQPVMSQPVMSQPVVSQPVVSQPVVSQPVVSQPVMSQPVMSQLVMSQPVMSQPVMSQPVVMAPVCEPPVAAGPTMSAGAFSILRTEPLPSGVSGVAGSSGISSVVAAAVPDGLEDLLRNQVPVEASALRLPPGVQIYGRPNRPQVLRLDPPQAAAAGPHFMAGVRQGRGDVVQEAASGETAAEQRLSRLARPLRGTSGNLRG